MKKITLLAFILGVCTLALQAQLPNAGFENWTHYPGGNPPYDDPDQWGTPNQLTAVIGVGIVSVTKDSANPHSGSYDPKIESKYVALASTSIPSMITNGTINVDLFSQTFSITGGSSLFGRPSSVDGYMRYVPQGASDSAFFMVILTHYAAGARDTVAVGLADYGAAASWTAFSVPLQYFNCNDPDTILVAFASGNPFTLQATDGTDLYVDDISLSFFSLESPPVANVDSIATPINTPVTATVQSNDCDYEGGVLTTSIVSQPTNGTAAVQVNGDILYTPDNGFTGMDYIMYALCDTAPECDSSFVVINVGGVTNSAPIAVDDNAFTNKDVDVTLDVQSNDSDPNGDNLTTTIQNFPLNGTVSVLGGDSILYSPNNNFVGTDSFSYQICDDGTPVLCGSAEVYVSVNPSAVNDLSSGLVVHTYPNPAMDKLNLVTSFNEPLNMLVYDLMGNVMLQLPLSERNASINISTLNSGVYFFKLEDAQFNVVGQGKFSVIK